MSTDNAEVWHHVREVRLDLADRVEGLDPEQAATPSLCEGWRVRDVVGHLVHLAEATQLSMARDVVRNGPSPQRALGRVAVRLGDLPLDELASRLRRAADGRFRVVGLPPATVLGEVVVHREDCAGARSASPSTSTRRRWSRRSTSTSASVGSRSDARSRASRSRRPT